MKERALIQFRNGSVSYLINDLAARVDIPEMNHVIHYHLPSKEEISHRNGRTARMLASGTPISLLMKVRKNGLH
jgi:superfamily II DNA/RNA helicase